MDFVTPRSKALRCLAHDFSDTIQTRKICMAGLEDQHLLYLPSAAARKARSLSANSGVWYARALHFATRATMQPRNRPEIVNSATISVRLGELFLSGSMAGSTTWIMGASRASSIRAASYCLASTS